ncbi:MAG: OmpA family protein [Bacteroidia bacterium]
MQSFFLNLKPFFTYVFVLFCCAINAQNLIPNPGYEERQKDGTPKYWTQPKGDFYHYEHQMVDTNGVEISNYLHGLCTIMPLPSEYLCVKLKKPVVAGKTYHFKVKTYVKDESWNRIEKLGYFELAVLPYYEKVTPVRIRIKATPLAQFTIDSNPERERPFWQYHHLTFTANSSGDYLYLGRFHTDSTYSLYDSLVSIKERMIKERDAQILHLRDSFSKLKVDIPDLGDSKKAIKKQKQLMFNFVNSAKKELNLMILEVQNNTNNLLDSVNQIYLDPFYFHVRLYYDDLCLAEVRNDNTCDCRDTMYVYKPKFEIGKTYALRNINFDLDKYVLLPQSYVELDNLLSIMREYPKMVIKIMGHTDSQNSDAYNITLSNNRAMACVKYLIKHGINAKRLSWQGYGERVPITTNDTEEGKAANRRVEFMVLKVE